MVDRHGTRSPRDLSIHPCQGTDKCVVYGATIALLAYCLLIILIYLHGFYKGVHLPSEFGFMYLFRYTSIVLVSTYFYCTWFYLLLLYLFLSTSIVLVSTYFYCTCGH